MGLRELRKRRGMTQSGLSRLSGLTQQQISDIETNRRPPENMTLGTAIKLMDALGIDNVRLLLNDADPIAANEAVTFYGEDSM